MVGVTFPIDPDLSVAMLQHLIDESPDRSDGAAVAAATAGYLVELRAQGKQKEELQFFTRQMLGQVAGITARWKNRRYSISGWSAWVERSRKISAAPQSGSRYLDRWRLVV